MGDSRAYKPLNPFLQWLLTLSLDKGTCSDVKLSITKFSSVGLPRTIWAVIDQTSTVRRAALHHQSQCSW